MLTEGHMTALERVVILFRQCLFEASHFLVAHFIDGLRVLVMVDWDIRWGF
jgi:hypothetical protein